jgi:hypothetical protein
MQAIELDPNFALARARLASVCAEVFRYYEPTESWRTKGPEPKRTLPFGCNRTLRKVTSHSASAFTGWTRITTKPWSNSRSRLVYHRVTRIHAAL